jgi:hypothetical protein
MTLTLSLKSPETSILESAPKKTIPRRSTLQNSLPIKEMQKLLVSLVAITEEVCSIINQIQGIGCGSSEIRAFEYVKKAAELGDTISSLNLGNCFLNGEGCDPSKDLAFKWYKIASEKGDTQATFCLSECYKQGIGCEIDMVKYRDLKQKVDLEDQMLAARGIVVLEADEAGFMRYSNQNKGSS